MDDSELTVDQRSSPEATVDQRRQMSGDATVDQRAGGDQTVDQRAGGVKLGRLRTILPDDLLTRFEPIRNLDVSAGQADLVLCRDRSTGEEVVVKLYRSALQLDRDVLAKLHRAETRHVVRLIDHGDADGEPWEVQEYCPLGTLTDYRVGQGGKLSEELVRLVVRELAEAIEHVHGLGITHRDLKPENVLVRSVSPLDLVLTDFGVAAEQIVSVQLQTMAASWAWAAPEVHTKGAVSYAIDWWALGAMVYQLLTGRHLLAGPDGRLPGDSKQIRAAVVDGLYTTDAIAQPRWRNLADGLLSYRPTERWGYAEVATWLSGGDPAVVRTVPAADLGPVREHHDLTYVFNGHPVRSGAELVAAMRRDWQAAGDLLSGRVDPTLADWLNARPDGTNAVQAIGLEKSGGARLIRLQAELDPGGPLEFQGVVVDDDSLTRAIQQANSWTPAASGAVARQHAWLQGLRRERILRAMAAVVGGAAAERLGRADRLLDTWAQQTRVVLDKIPGAADRTVAEGREQAMLAFLFAVALGSAADTDTDAEAARAVAAAESRDTVRAPWAEDLALRVLAAQRTDLGLLIPAAAAIERVTADNAVRKQKERAERDARERREREERDRREHEQAEARERAERDRLTRERQARTRRRSSRLPGQIRARGLTSVGYSAIAGFVAALTASFPDGPSARLVWHYGLPILMACLVTVALSLIVDWFLDSPRGGLHRVSATVGFVVGAAAWVDLVSAGPGQDGDGWLVVMPQAFGISWMIGAVLEYAFDHSTATHGDNATSGAITRSARWRLFPTALGGVAGVSALFFGHCWGTCADVAQGARQIVGNVGALQVDPLGIGGSPTLIVVLAVAACALHVAAAGLGRLAPPLGVAAAVAGPLLGITVFLAYEPNIIGLIIGGFAGPAS